MDMNMVGNKSLWIVVVLLTMLIGTVVCAVIPAKSEEPGKIYWLDLQKIDGQQYMKLLEPVSVIDGYAPDYKSGGDWWFQLIDARQHVLEEGYFSFTGTICPENGCCHKVVNPKLSLAIPYHSDATDITVYDGNGLVRFGPYDVSNMGEVTPDYCGNGITVPMEQCDNAGCMSTCQTYRAAA